MLNFIVQSRETRTRRHSLTKWGSPWNEIVTVHLWRVCKLRSLRLKPARKPTVECGIFIYNIFTTFLTHRVNDFDRVLREKVIHETEMKESLTFRNLSLEDPDWRNKVKKKKDKMIPFDIGSLLIIILNSYLEIILYISTARFIKHAYHIWFQWQEWIRTFIERNKSSTR